VINRHYVQHGRTFLKHVIPAVLTPLRTLWHEVIGFLFLCLAIIPSFSAYRAIRSFDGEPGSLIRIVMTLIFIGIMTGYGISSFRRAKKISRS
jgi:hypothetical protein